MTKEGHPLQIIEGLPERRALATVRTQGEPEACLSSLCLPGSTPQTRVEFYNHLLLGTTPDSSLFIRALPTQNSCILPFEALISLVPSTISS